LEQRQSQLEQELADIQSVLRGEARPPARAKITAPAVLAPTPRAHPNRGLTKAVVALLANGPLTKDDIVSKLKAQNFPFFGSPKPALDPVLYGKKFKREGKLFRLAEAPKYRISSQRANHANLKKHNEVAENQSWES